MSEARVADTEEETPAFDIEGLSQAELTLRVALSFEELASLAELFGVEGFPGVPEELFAGVRPEIRDAMLSTASRSLIARRVVRVLDEEEGTVEVVQPYAAVLGVVLEPDVVLTGQQQVGEESETRILYVSDDLMVEQSTPADFIHEFALLDAEDLLPYALDLGDDRDSSEVGSELTMPVHALDRLEDLIADGDLDGAKALVPGGSPFVDALLQTRRSNHLQALHRDGERVVGGELTWVDGASRGIWLIDRVEDTDGQPDGDPLLRIRSVTAQELMDRLRSYLPESLELG